MKKIMFVVLSAALGFATVAMAITPPTISQPKPGLLRFSWTVPITRQDGSPLSPSEIGSYKLYLTNEAAVISIPGSATSYDYTVPVGYTTLSTDVAQISTVDNKGVEGSASASVALPIGTTSPKSLPGAPTSLKVVAP